MSLFTFNLKEKDKEIEELKKIILKMKEQNESLHEENKKLREFILNINSDINDLFKIQ